MINIEFISQCLDCSGYASTARSTILALKKRGYGLKLIYKDFGARKIELTDKNRDLLGLFDSDIVPDIRHVHLTPENIMEFNKRDIPLIAYPAWETTKLPIEWVGYMNEADVLVVPCEYQKQVMINDGVSVPIHVVGHLVDTDLFNINNNIIKQDNMFCFYIARGIQPHNMMDWHISGFQYSDFCKLLDIRPVKDEQKYGCCSNFPATMAEEDQEDNDTFFV